MDALAFIALFGLILPAVAAATTEVRDRIESNRLHREVLRTFAVAKSD
ncbi:hypothetical protein OV079_26640 [Nannocystis pusilla]|jgi:hypothetical protein|uniref:Uncharacterized protein n=1 Tax=Nannocystis pusilla TaxID=889268 RepID=A0A9X3ETP0_9BACT|nr:hypothetical protein [Nannocystis pusilla]MCY1009075.1 hypothetical protein [Nannocystis pusilla]